MVTILDAILDLGNFWLSSSLDYHLERFPVPQNIHLGTSIIYVTYLEANLWWHLKMAAILDAILDFEESPQGIFGEF